MFNESIEVNETNLAKHLQEQEKRELEYEAMCDEIEKAIEIDEIITKFNKIVESHGFDIDFQDFLNER